eukprot:m51a1_g11264 hypothetical protein (160) ;mRNA; r:20978-22594
MSTPSSVVVHIGSFFLVTIAFPIAFASGNLLSSPMFILAIICIVTFVVCCVLHAVILCVLQGGHVVAISTPTAVSPKEAPPAPAYYAAEAASTSPQYGATAPAPQYYGAPSSAPVAPPGYGCGAGATYEPPGAPPSYDDNSQAACYGTPPPLMGIPKAM